MKFKKNINKTLFLTFTLFVVIGNMGIWYMPNISFQFLVSQSLMVNPFVDPNAHYIYTNYFEPLIFGMLGGSTLNQYLLYTLVVTILFFMVFVLWFLKYHKNITDKYCKVLSVIIFPVFMVPFYWIGMDGMTLLLMLLVMINYQSRWGNVFAVLLGLQHFEQGVASFSLLIGTLIISNLLSKNNTNWYAVKRNSHLIIGIIFGKLLLYTWFNIAGIEILGNRFTYLENHLGLFFNQWIASWPYILFSFFGIGWIFVLKHIKSTYPLLLATIITFFFVITVGDQTRVGSIILFPSLFYWVFMNAKILNKISFKYTIATLSFYLLIPVVYVWGGYPFGSLLKYDLNIFQEAKHLNYVPDFIAPFKRNNKLLFNSIIINGSDLNNIIGQVDDKFRMAKSEIDQAGYITFGPYIKLEKGSYKFDISYISSEVSTVIVGTWDVGVALPNDMKRLKKNNLMGTDNQDGHIIESFTIPEEYSGEKIEIRNFYNGTGDLTIKSLTITRVQ